MAAAAPSTCLHTRIAKVEGKRAGKSYLLKSLSSSFESGNFPYSHQPEPGPVIIIILSRVMGLPQEALAELDESSESGHVASGTKL